MEKPSGEELYVSYCLICHGDDGKGNGTMAELLKTPPPDLTQISARRGGTFPTEEIHQFIDGRIEVPGHGRGEMPVWGATFKASEHLNNEAEVSARIDELVKYLKNLQQ